MTAGGATALDPWRDPRTRALETEVATTQAALIDAEIALETAKVEIANFAAAHHHRLGPLYERLDELDALIAEAIAARTGAPEDIRRAYEARGVVTDLPDLDELFARLTGETRADADQADRADQPEPAEAPAPPTVRPSEEARRLYRELARRAHPDLTQDEAEKRRRGAFIARVNEAYAAGDVAALRELGAEWAAGPDAAPPAGAADRASWLRSRLDWLRAALAGVAAQREELAASAIGQLLSLAPDDPDALLAELAAQLAGQVAERERRLRDLIAG